MISQQTKKELSYLWNQAKDLFSFDETFDEPLNPNLNAPENRKNLEIIEAFKWDRNGGRSIIRTADDPDYVRPDYGNKITKGIYTPGEILRARLTFNAAKNTDTERSVTVTATVTVNGKSATQTATVSQNGEGVSSYGALVIDSFSYDPSTQTAAGGTSTPTVTYSQEVTYLSGATETIHSGATVTYSGSATGFTLAADGKVTAAKNTGTERSITVTAKVELNGKSATQTATVTQNGDSISSYDTPVIDSFSYSPNPMTVAAGTSTPTVTYTQTVHYASGETGTIHSGAAVTYSGSATGFSVNSSTGVVTAEKNTGNERSVTVTATVTVNGKSKTETATVTQSGDGIESYGDPVITLSYSPNPVSAVGGTATPDLKYTQTINYLSGETSTVTSGAVVSYEGSATGFTLNNTSGLVSAAKNTGSARSIDVTVKVKINGKESTKTATINQEGDSVVSYSDLTITAFAYNPTTISAGGGATTVSELKYTQTVTYASGSTNTLTSGATVTYAGTADGFSIDANTGTVTAQRNTDIERSVDVTAIVTLNGKTATRTTTVEQESKLIVITGHQSGSNYLIQSDKPIPNSGVTVYFAVDYDLQGGGQKRKTGCERSIAHEQTSISPAYLYSDLKDPQAAAIVGGEITGVSPTTFQDYTFTYRNTDYAASFDAPVINVSYSPSMLDFTGGQTATPTVTYSQTVHYRSGATDVLTSGGSIKYYGSAPGFSLNQTTGKVSTSYNSGSRRSIVVTVVVSMNGKMSSKTIEVFQDGNNIITIEGRATGTNFEIMASQPVHGDINVTFEVNYEKNNGEKGTAGDFSVTIRNGKSAPTSQFGISSIPVTNIKAITGGKIKGVTPGTAGSYTYNYSNP